MYVQVLMMCSSLLPCDPFFDVQFKEFVLKHSHRRGAKIARDCVHEEETTNEIGLQTQDAIFLLLVFSRQESRSEIDLVKIKMSTRLSTAKHTLNSDAWS